MPDIEELTICSKSGAICKQKCHDVDDEWCILNTNDLDEDTFIQFELSDGKVWYAVNTLYDVFNILNTVGNQDYMLMNGNTAQGKYIKRKTPLSPERGLLYRQNIMWLHPLCYVSLCMCTNLSIIKSIKSYILMSY